jgi:hypothetical protein
VLSGEAQLALLTACVAVAAGALAGCSDSRIATSLEPIARAAKAADRAAVQPANTALGERFAADALDDSQLGGIRGGLSTSSGLVVNFSFQEATYVNHNLAQSIVVPTMTVSPGSATGVVATVAASGSALTPLVDTAKQAQVSSPALAIQSILNNGMTSVVSNLGAGVTNTISNAANNQLIQQVITANIGITGLSQTLQQNVASTASRLVAANSQFR